MSSITILGGGVSGLSYAYGQLTKGGHSVVVFEKSDTIGGLMRSFCFDGFLFDFGPHIVRSRNTSILKFAKNLLHHNYHDISSSPVIFKQGRFYDHVIPSVTYNTIKNLPQEIKKKVRKELKVRRKIDFTNFENCIISQIGETLYWEFFGEYSRKWWGISPSDLSSDLAPKNLFIDGERAYGHITTHFEKPLEEIYPLRGGILTIIQTLKEEIRNRKGTIVTNSKIKSFEYDGDEIDTIVMERNGDEIEIRTRDPIISTIPLTSISKMLGMESDLAYRGDICIFLKLDGKKMFNWSWIYFHNPDIVFSRIYEPLYYSKFNAPPRHTSLGVEVSSSEDDKIWNDKYLGDTVVEQLLDLRVIKPSQNPQILGAIKHPHAFPLYTVDYKQKRERLLKKLAAFRNLQLIGRTGSFSYLNMLECLQWAFN